jgi:hypothetical protein
MLFPLRHWLYPGDVLWTEEGYRFSWNVMLAEKTGMALFHVTDAETGQRWIVFPNEYLTPQQEKQMSFQPDMILQFAHFLADIFRTHGHSDIRVTVDSFVSLNGRPSQRFIQEGIDLTRLHNSIFHKEWITQAASSP